MSPAGFWRNIFNGAISVSHWVWKTTTTAAPKHTSHWLYSKSSAKDTIAIKSPPFTPLHSILHLETEDFLLTLVQFEFEVANRNQILTVISDSWHFVLRIEHHISQPGVPEGRKTSLSWQAFYYSSQSRVKVHQSCADVLHPHEGNPLVPNIALNEVIDFILKLVRFKMLVWPAFRESDFKY